MSCGVDACLSSDEFWDFLGVRACLPLGLRIGTSVDVSTLGLVKGINDICNSVVSQCPIPDLRLCCFTCTFRI